MRTSHVFFFEGQARTLADIASRTGLTYDTLRHRVIRAGMSIEDAISKPIAPHTLRNPNGRTPRLYWFRGERRSITSVAAELGVARTTVSGRIIGDTILEADEAKAIPCERGDGERLLTFKGTSRNVSEWARALGISKNTIHNRLDRGWSIARALSEPVVHPRRVVLARMITRWRRARNAALVARMVAAFATTSQATTGGCSELSAMSRGPAGGAA